MLHEPQLPQISSASLTVDSRHLLYGNGLVDSLPQPETMKTIRFLLLSLPLTLMAGATALAWHYLPTQLPLAVLLSYWWAVAAGDRLPNELFPRDQSGLAQHEFNCSVSLCLMRAASSMV